MSHKKDHNGNGHFGKVDESGAETLQDRRAAILCVLYLLLFLVFFTWQLLDTWIGRHSLLSSVGYNPGRLNTPGFRLVAFTIIGGGIGGVLNGIRSILNYYNEFNRKYAWKYLAVPWMGATLALFAYAVLHSSMGILVGGDPATGSANATQVLFNFAAGALAGYGSKDVFIWLDAKVQKIFRVEVPNLKGKNESAAVSLLHDADLEVGKISEVPQKDGKRKGIVIDQSPPPKASLDRGEPVDIAVTTSKVA